MSIVTGNPGISTTDGGVEGIPVVVRIGPDLLAAAAARLVADQSPDPTAAARRFLESAEALNIDLSLLWGTVDESTGSVRQACLAVAGAGRTAMLFVSGPLKRGRHWMSGGKRGVSDLAGSDAEHRERVAVLDRACTELGAESESAPARVCLAQALLEPKEREAGAALRGAGFAQLGDLAYLRRKLAARITTAGELPWPEGIRIETVAGLSQRGGGPGEIDILLGRALERSYIETLDCPELCGLRDLSDVLESHRSVGAYDPALWWVISAPEPEGCMLFNICQDHDSVELVYLGLSPALRGRGIGSRLLRFGIDEVERHFVGDADTERGRLRIAGSGGLTCAVDTRNVPAMNLYSHAGFHRFATRVPYVRSLRGAASGGGHNIS